MAGSCARVMAFSGRSYWEARKVEFTVGDKVGTARPSPCHDVGGVDLGGASRSDDAKTTTRNTASYNVYKVKGLDTAVAVAIGDSPDQTVLFSVRGERGGIPPEVKKLIKPT